MTHEQFEAIVARAETAAARHPTRYRVEVSLFALVGYVYIGIALAVLAALTAGIIYLIITGAPGPLMIKLAIPLVVLQFAVLRALAVRVPPPEGIEITLDDAPELVAEVERVRRAMNGPRVHHILLTDELNAAIAQVPRLGVLGWYRNYVIIGVPILHALSPDEFTAVLAHEFGHLSRAHGQTGMRVYRARLTWYRIMEAVQQKGSFVFQRFFRWYAPNFGARSFALARAHEYEADRLAASVSGAESTASALVRIRLAAMLLERVHWKDFYSWGRADDAMPEDVVTGVCRFLADAEHRPQTGWLAEALSHTTAADDTHPALAARLAALGYASREEIGLLLSADAADQTAAHSFLPQARKFLTRLDRRWGADTEEAWYQQRERRGELVERLKELERASANRQLNGDDMAERASAMAELGNTRAAVETLRSFLRHTPGHPAASYVLGRLLLDQDDDAGLELLEAARAADRQLTGVACSTAQAYLLRIGRVEEARALDGTWREFERLLEEDAVERAADAVSATDELLPHELAIDRVDVLTAQLLRRDEVAAAWLVRKAMRTFPERPLYVLGVEADWRECLRPPAEAAPELLDLLVRSLSLPDECIVMIINYGNDRLMHRMREVPAARIFDRKLVAAET